MLYCKSCNYVVDTGRNACLNCNNGFVSSLVCGTCYKDVPRGRSSCATCHRVSVPLDVPRGYSEQGPPNVQIAVLPFVEQEAPRPPRPPTGALAIPGLPAGLMVPVQDAYSHGRFGAEAEVKLNGRDADILTKMKQTGALLHALAQEMNGLQGHMQSTRALIRACRTMAADLLEEVEVRLGPQG